MTHALTSTAAEAALIAEYAGLAPRYWGEKGEREAAIEQIRTRGLPHRRVEEWKYSDLRGYLKQALPAAIRGGSDNVREAMALGDLLAGMEAAHISLINGFVGQWSGLPDGIDMMPMLDAVKAKHRILDHAGLLAGENNTALDWNTAFSVGGVALSVRAGRKVELPLHLDLRLVGEAATAYPRHLVHLGAGASLTLIETICGSGAHHLNSVAEIVLEEGASLTHIILNTAGRADLHVAQRGVQLGVNAHYASFTLNEGIGFAREQSFVRFSGEGGSVSLSGATLANARHLADTTLVVSHDVPRCTSRETFKYALDNEARGVFQGKIIVRPHAQKTDGQMKADALMLREGPEFDAKPELEIFADDVVCAHGATAGEIDEDLLFYMKARGLPEKEARALMVQAFIGLALETIADEALRAIVEERVSHWLAAHG